MQQEEKTSAAVEAVPVVMVAAQDKIKLAALEVEES